MRFPYHGPDVDILDYFPDGMDRDLTAACACRRTAGDGTATAVIEPLPGLKRISERTIRHA